MYEDEIQLSLRAEVIALRRRIETLEAVLDVGRATASSASLRDLHGVVSRLARSNTRLPVDDLLKFARTVETFDERNWVRAKFETSEPMPWIDFLRVLVRHRGVGGHYRDRAEAHLREVVINLLELEGYGRIDPDEFLGLGDAREECVASFLGGL